MDEIVPQALLFTVSGGLAYGVYGTEVGRRLRSREVGRLLLCSVGTFVVLLFGAEFGAEDLEEWVYWFFIASIPVYIGGTWADSSSSNQDAVDQYRLPPRGE